MKVINETHQLGISQKVVKERIDKIYKYIKNQVIFNKEKFDINELIFLKNIYKVLKEKILIIIQEQYFILCYFYMKMKNFFVAY